MGIRLKFDQSQITNESFPTCASPSPLPALLLQRMCKGMGHGCTWIFRILVLDVANMEIGIEHRYVMWSGE